MERQRALPAMTFFIVVLLHATPLFAQFDFPAMSGSAAAMGGTTVAVSDPMSANSSIADLASLESTTITLAVRQNLLSDGIGLASISTSVPMSFGGMALSAIHFGDADYNEQSLSMAYALPLGKEIALGAAFHYLHSTTSDPYYEPLHRFTFSLAMRYTPSDELSIAFRAYNPLAVLSDNNEGVHTPAVFTLGASYQIIEGFLAASEVEKNLYFNTTFRFGLQYCFLEKYFARIGLSTQPATYSFGIGGRWKHLGADMAFLFSSALGPTSMLSVSYSF